MQLARHDVITRSCVVSGGHRNDDLELPGVGHKNLVSAIEEVWLRLRVSRYGKNETFLVVDIELEWHQKLVACRVGLDAVSVGDPHRNVDGRGSAGGYGYRRFIAHRNGPGGRRGWRWFIALGTGDPTSRQHDGNDYSASSSSSKRAVSETSLASKFRESNSE